MNLKFRAQMARNWINNEFIKSNTFPAKYLVSFNDRPIPSAGTFSSYKSWRRSESSDKQVFHWAAQHLNKIERQKFISHLRKMAEN